MFKTMFKIKHDFKNTEYHEQKNWCTGYALKWNILKKKIDNHWFTANIWSMNKVENEELIIL